MNQEHLPFRLGITGGIGSGKTSVCRIFTVLGIPVFSADPVASEIMDNDTDIRTKINSIAGKDIYNAGTLDRTELAKLIFSDPLLLIKVNELIHPLVFGRFDSWAKKQDAPYVIMEAAILFESGASKLVDRILTVVAPVEQRIERVIRRNNLTYEQVCQRIKNQIADEERISQSDYVISNSENDMIIPAVIKVHNDLMNHLNKV